MELSAGGRAGAHLSSQCLFFCSLHHTVIGRKVNLAARMMMYYPGLVSCDAVTYSNSRLSPYFFEELPQIEMKGVVNPGLVYHYLGITEKT